MDEPKTDQPPIGNPDTEPPAEIKAQLRPDDHPEPAKLPDHIAEQPLPRTEQLILPPKDHRRVYLINGLILLLIILAAAAYFVFKNKDNQPRPTASLSSNSSQTASTSTLPGLQLDPNKNYGNKYANGIVPVGDGLYQSSGPKTGYIYTCQGYANNLASSAGGAGQRGPWFVGTSQYDVNKKLHVQGSVMWQADFSNIVSGNTRTIITNDLPSHPTGVFPISPTDPAYAYDKNPNSIKGQTFTYKLPTDSSYSATPNCIGGDVGIMLSGVALFSGLDAGGRDAGAWEVQDACDGHPQKDGIYHYHTLSACIKNVSVKTVIGFALDGFPITGPQVGANNYLTTADLDECHGLTSQVVLDGKTVTTYHYVMTQDYPYSVSCFRATAIQPPDKVPAG